MSKPAARTCWNRRGLSSRGATPLTPSAASPIMPAARKEAPMPEPLTLTLGALALTEGVKFFYAQAGELLKWWRERRDKKPEAPEPAQVVLPDHVFAEQLQDPRIHFDKLDPLAKPLKELLGSLAPYHADPDSI